ncbi:MAG: asparagine synthase (glutamine-hydrolyzing) [Saprospiraceae bacterium]|nr:asparagine synthase (glutamine-hydrolyzing) [Saprospiraceae bacterium]
MCGICGFNHRDKNGLSAMLTKLQHRGPDHEGLYLNDDWSLGMRRLAIIDLAGGQQPVWNEDQSICAVINGEIYNYKKIRNLLLECGHKLTSVADSEIIVHLYEEFGFEMFDYLEGMFSFCILDLANNTCILARDRFGEKPLYYFHKGADFAFASEIQSLLKFPGIERKLNTAHLRSLLHFGYNLHPATLLQNVQLLKPGHFVVFKNGNLESKAYYQWNYDHIKTNIEEHEALQVGRNLLVQSVEKQMVADVPLGCFLSGGIDSSTISAIMQNLSSKAINTFNAKFEEADFDESAIARKVAKHLGSDHHELFVPNAVFQESFFWELLTHTGQPFIDSSSIPSYLISKEIQNHVKVVLSGDGGDELFGGYEDFRWGTQIEFLRKLGPNLNSIVLSFIQALPELSVRTKDWKRGALKALEISARQENELISLLYAIFSGDEQTQLLKNKWSSNNALPYPEHFANWSTMRKLMWFRTAYSLPDDMLVKVDRMSMRHSIEVRCPFLDRSLFEFAATLPDHFLRRGKQNKWLLRKMMQNMLPQEVFSHPKQGFNFPLHKFFNPAFKTFCYATMHKNHPLFELMDYASVMQIVKSGFEQNQSTAQQSIYKSAHKLWLLLQIFAWTTHFEIDIDCSSNVN